MLPRMFHQLIGQMKKQLGQLDQWLDAATAYAKDKKFEPNLVLSYRLAPDQLPLSSQVQIACDTAKLGAARLAGKPAPSHADTEITIDQLHARVRSVIEYLGSFSEADFAEAATRTITQPRWEGKTMTGADYFVEHSLPNFFFHVSHTYAILRHIGVPLGKRDYLGALPLRAP
jgi:hypothetical protein